jgi:hypothetical protein
MVALQAQTLTNSASGATVIGPSRSLRIVTGDVIAKRRSTDLIPKPPGLTDVSTIDRENIIFSTTTGLGQSQRDPEFSHVTGLRKVNAVIDKITPDSVVVCCLLPNTKLDLRLPPSLIPAELLSYGQPVTISLRTEGGIRAPLIERREITAQEPFTDQDKINEWIESI